MALRAGRLLPLVQAAVADTCATAQRCLSNSFASTSGPAPQSSAAGLAVNVSRSGAGAARRCRWCTAASMARAAPAGC
jgi:hypothetical protein